MKKRPTLYLHIGTHKTGTSYIQNLFSEARDILIKTDSLLFPKSGIDVNDQVKTREGGISGQRLFTRQDMGRQTLDKLILECEATKAQKVFISSENFTSLKRDISAQFYIDRFKYFSDIKIILLLRRQDKWLESLYKQWVDGHVEAETRTIADFIEHIGVIQFDYLKRFSQWVDVVGEDNFIVGSYDDIAKDKNLVNWFGSQLGLSEQSTINLNNIEVPAYTSISALDSYILRILNGLEIPSRNVRNLIVQDIYKIPTTKDVTLVSKELFEKLKIAHLDMNAWIAKNWIKEDCKEFTNWNRLEDNKEKIPTLEDPTVLKKLNAMLTGLDRHAYSDSYKNAYFEISKKIQNIHRGVQIEKNKLSERNKELTKAKGALESKRKEELALNQKIKTIQTRLNECGEKLSLRNHELTSLKDSFKLQSDKLSQRNKEIEALLEKQLRNRLKKFFRWF